MSSPASRAAHSHIVLVIRHPAPEGLDEKSDQTARLHRPSQRRVVVAPYAAGGACAGGRPNAATSSVRQKLSTVAAVVGVRDLTLDPTRWSLPFWSETRIHDGCIALGGDSDRKSTRLNS